MKEIEMKIIRNEFRRYDEIAHNAINNAEARALISETLEALQE
jgi:hypothetical protein